MQITTGKSGTTLKLNTTEKRKLAEAGRILWAISKHGDSAVSDVADQACDLIEKVETLLHPLTANETATT